MPYDNPYSGQAPIFGPLSRALQLYSIVHGMQNQDQDRQRAYQQQQLDNQTRQQQLERQGEQDRYSRMRQDTQDQYAQGQDTLRNTLAMNQLGAKPGNPQAEAMLDQIFGKVQNPRQAVGVGGQTYYVPTQQEQYQRSLKETLDKSKLDVAGQMLLNQALLPYKVAGIQAQSAAQQQRLQPHIVTNDQGDVTGINPYTGQKLYTTPGVAATKSDKTSKDKAPVQQMQRFEDLKAQSQEALRQAQIFGAQAQTGDQKAMLQYQQALAKAKSLEEQTKAHGQNLAKIYKGKLEYGEDAGGYPYIKWNSPQEEE